MKIELVITVEAEIEVSDTDKKRKIASLKKSIKSLDGVTYVDIGIVEKTTITKGVMVDGKVVACQSGPYPHPLEKSKDK